MVDARKSAQARRQQRLSDGRFAGGDRSQIPSGEMLDRYAVDDRIKLDDRLADAGFDVAPTFLNEGYGLDARIVTRPVSAGQSARRCVLMPLEDGRTRMVMERYRKLRLRELLDLRGMSGSEKIMAVASAPFDLIGNKTESYEWMREGETETDDGQRIVEEAEQWCDHGPGPAAFQLR